MPIQSSHKRLPRRARLAVEPIRPPIIRRRRCWFEQLEDRRMLAAVPELVRDINLNSWYSFIDHEWSLVTCVRSLSIYFVGALGGIPSTISHRIPQLWKSDGTRAGTVLVKDITPGSCSLLSGQSDQRQRHAVLHCR